MDVNEGMQEAFPYPTISFRGKCPMGEATPDHSRGCPHCSKVVTSSQSSLTISFHDTDRMQARNTRHSETLDGQAQQNENLVLESDRK